MDAPSSPENDPLPWLAALCNPATYGHPVSNISLINTHLSVIALTGPFAYKLKKPVDYGFVNFKTLERRKHFCEEELRLNLRTAPELYLDVVPLIHARAGWHFGGTETPAEYAVRMHQFNPEERLDRVAHETGLRAEVIDGLARQIAALHENAARAEGSMAGDYPNRLMNAALENLKALPEMPAQKKLHEIFPIRLAQCRDVLSERALRGMVRDCHGDLHLENICLHAGRPLLFDCIEFTTDFRIIDVLSDMAFLFMDLLARDFSKEAYRVLSKYLEITGDYAGLEAWPLFVGYRAGVRAKIAELTSRAPGVSQATCPDLRKRRDHYLDLASRWLKAGRGKIILMAGLPGSGKSTAGNQLVESEGGVLVRSDVERKRLHQSMPSEALYGSVLGQKTYQLLLNHARAIVMGGLTAILDATYIRRTQREAVLLLAQELDVPIRIVHCTAPEQVLRKRIQKRLEAQNDASDADELVMEKMIRDWEPFSDAEQEFVEEYPYLPAL